MSSTQGRTRPRTALGATALAVAAVMFVLYPAVRPWHDETTVADATAAMSSPAWVAAHYFAMIGFILVPLGLLTLRDLVAGTRAERAAFAAIVVTWLGAGLTLPYYGAEDFALHALAAKADDGLSPYLLTTVSAIRYQPVAITTFGVGLVLLGIGAILAAVGVWRSDVLPRYAGIVFAAGFALFLPQFYVPPAARIAHGVLLGVGLAWLAFALNRAPRTDR